MKVSVKVLIECSSGQCQPCKFLIYSVGDPFPWECGLFKEKLKESLAAKLNQNFYSSERTGDAHRCLTCLDSCACSC